jgi:2-oxo-4-hydroxy-4-carboxy--5-ureidoimidazoline (OHCU) decarboxylase
VERSRESFATLFEGAPRFVDRLSALPADSWEDLFTQAEWTALTMPEDEQIELLNAHPRIGATPASVSALSYREQGYDKDAGTTELQARLDTLNDEYERRNGFRFVIFVNGRSRAEIADIMERHIDADRMHEKVRGLRDVIAIARSRVAKERE